MTKHLVLGNGESRAWFNPSEKLSFKWKTSNDVTTWGCNAIHRDGHVDNLVAIDYGIQQEVYQSGYHKWSQCWFLDWNPVPAEIADMMLMGQNISESDIHKTERVGNHTEQCVIAGTDPTKPHKKDEKDVGIWITYVKDTDTIKNIESPKNWIAGTTAAHLACQQGAKEVYLVGFDLSSPNELINNIYKGTDYYFPEDSKGFSTVSWVNQLGAIFDTFSDTQFYWVDCKERTVGVFLEKNLGYLTKSELCDTLNIQ